MKTRHNNATRRSIIGCALLIAALLQVTVPAVAAKATKSPPATMRPLTPAPWALADESSGCGTASVGVCSTSTTPTSDPAVLEPRVSVADPIDPVPVPGHAHKFARYRQIAQATTTKAVKSVTFDWTFVVDEPLGATSQGTQGTSRWSTQITTDVESTYCSPVLLPQKVLMRESNTIIPAGTRYTYRFTFNPCAGEAAIPAGTTMKVTADVWLNVSRQGPNGPLSGWNGRADHTGTIRSVITSDAV